MVISVTSRNPEQGDNHLIIARDSNTFVYNNVLHCVWACPEIYVVCHIINVHSLLEVILEGVSICRTRA